ncbi:MAG: hypothetical protein GX081_03915 [Firmicutes bacterium]|nr:hypothetical protein [Bacillota bacterium]
MLNPNRRLVYTSELAPPPGYEFDRAIATTFSLDLLTLLIAPLSLALFNVKNKEEVLKDNIAVIEALQRTVKRLGIFCQQGRILEVNPQREHGVFHPKIWLLRFTNGEDILYRFICLSRNMTFDQSWDTVLTLEGRLEQQRKNAFARNRPLADFIRRLPEYSVNPVPDRIKEDAFLLADEVLRVRFEAPTGFDEQLAFYPLGLSGVPQLKFANYSRLMIVSPFLSEELLVSLLANGQNNVLISRGDALDAIPDATLRRIKANTEIYIFDEAGERPEAAELENLEEDGPSIEEDRSGLHAKLYILEKGWEARLLTGSANATEAGFRGGNVEFLVELTGKKSRVGIDQILGNENDQDSLRNLLRHYQRTEEDERPDQTVRKKLEKALEEARTAIRRAALMLTVSSDRDGTYAMKLRAKAQLQLGPEIVHARCYPVTLKPIDARGITELSPKNPIVFLNMSEVSLTGYFAFELEGKYMTETGNLSFVLNLPVEGMPPERDKRILQSIISDQNRFLRYLLFLLADKDDTFLIDTNFKEGVGFSGVETAVGLNLPILEELVRAYSRNPKTIERINRLVTEISDSPEQEQILPEGFKQLWTAFEAAVSTEGVKRDD